MWLLIWIEYLRRCCKHLHIVGFNQSVRLIQSMTRAKSHIFICIKSCMCTPHNHRMFMFERSLLLNTIGTQLPGYYILANWIISNVLSTTSTVVTSHLATVHHDTTWCIIETATVANNNQYNALTLLRPHSHTMDIFYPCWAVYQRRELNEKKNIEINISDVNVFVRFPYSQQWFPLHIFTSFTNSQLISVHYYRC